MKTMEQTKRLYWKKVLTFWMPLLAFIVGLQFIFLGIGLNEFPEIASKAINLCLG